MFKRRLQEERERLDINQKELSALLGVSPAAISMWENGERKPDTVKLLSLATVFNVSIDYLLGRTDDRSAPAKPEEIKVKDLRAALRKSDAGEPLTPEEQKLLDTVRQQSAEMQTALREVLDGPGKAISQAVGDALAPGTAGGHYRAITVAKTLEQALSDYGGFMRILVSSGRLTEEEAIKAVEKAVSGIEL